ncbi:MAG: polyamine aminopropyltransferase [Phaeodactylibacter sp.]|nr:polyamine aminopropyltransferase [Phaeodactylibacter sp.]
MSESRLFDEKLVLIISIFIAGLCSIIYELLISTTSSYFLGDSVRHFSITIGVYMASMGLGSFLSRLIQGQLLLKFIAVEIVLGLVGGACIPLLYWFYAETDYWGFWTLMILLITVIGTLTGLEIPLLARILKTHYPLKINLSNVLSLDYFGALLATLLFPFLLLPLIGTFKTSLIFGLINIGIGFLNLWFFAPILPLRKRRVFNLAALTVSVFFGVMLFFSQGLLKYWNESLYRDPIIYQKQSPYQQLILTKSGPDIRLYLNKVIQWSSVDEYRYHESLVHLPMMQARHRKNVLVLGGGEGLAVREILKYPEVEQVIIVDLDQAVFDLAKDNHFLQEINARSLYSEKVIPITEDAYQFLQQTQQLFDLIIIDLPDPSNESLARLYSREFYKLATKRLAAQGIMVTQATSPFFSKRSFWCIAASMEAGGMINVYPYHTYVPSFGDWGFVMGARFPMDSMQWKLEVPTQYLEDAHIQERFYFAKDFQVQDTVINTLDHPTLLNLYLDDTRRWNRIGI